MRRSVRGRRPSFTRPRRERCPNASKTHGMTPSTRCDGSERAARSNGGASFAFVSEAVVGELIGLAELETGDHVVRFCGRDLGIVDRRGVIPSFRSAPSGAPLNDGTTPHTQNLSTISPVQNVEDQPG